ncbi:hypothetical protein GCM10027217_22670 [Pseudomaricurvus hydrocarbonicus]
MTRLNGKRAVAFAVLIKLEDSRIRNIEMTAHPGSDQTQETSENLAPEANLFKANKISLLEPPHEFRPAA